MAEFIAPDRQWFAEFRELQERGRLASDILVRLVHLVTPPFEWGTLVELGYRSHYRPYLGAHPQRVPPAAGAGQSVSPPMRPPNTIYHFLLPAPGMASYADKAAKALEAQHFERIKAWHKTFFQPFTEADIANLFTPATADTCLEHDERGEVPGIMKESG